MLSEIDNFIESNIKEPISENVRAVITSLCREVFSYRHEKEANDRINTEMAISYNALMNENKELKEELNSVKIMLAKEIDKNAIKNKAIFGSHTEKLVSLIEAAVNQKDEDGEDEAATEDTIRETGKNSKIINFNKNTNDDTNVCSEGSDSSDYKNPDKIKKDNQTDKKSRKHGLKTSLDNLPQEYTYLYDVEKLNEMYGENNWRISGWHLHRKLAKLQVEYYTQNIYTPVISYALGDHMSTIPYCNSLVDKSYLSESVFSDILYKKFVLSLPTYRQSADLAIKGIELPRQTMIRWINSVVPRLFTPVFEYMLNELISYGYIQSDETFMKVNHNEKGSNTKGYMWIHTSSELLDCNPIAIFCYEPTRNTDHLRNIFGDFTGCISCDAYVSYHVLEEENEGIYTSGCLMHARRYLATALFLNDIEKLSYEELSELPETKALLLIRDIYAAENPLKSLSASERQSRRNTDVRPKVDAFFKYIHELAASGEVFSDRLTSAIKYSINQEIYLRRFLEDGNIPCDNGKSERLARSYSIGRSNWLFADTVKGAEVNAIVYSITETAKANGVNVKIYLQYLLEKLPPMIDKPDQKFMEGMMPWSDDYHKYELAFRENALKMMDRLFPRTEKPSSRPKKLIITDCYPIEDAAI